MSELRRRTLEKFLSGGRVIKKIGHLDGRARRTGHLPLVFQHAAFDAYVGPGGGPQSDGDQADFGHGRDARQSLATKAHGADAEEVCFATEFAGGMADKCERRIGGHHALSIVTDPNETPSGLRDIDGHARRSGVHRVLDEFLDDRCGALHDFAGRDPVGDLHGKHHDF